VVLTVKLTHKRKPRKKKVEGEDNGHIGK